ncbi:MAG: hypothetical protein WCA45_11420 [Thiobacillaceae bacterium]
MPARRLIEQSSKHRGLLVDRDTIQALIHREGKSGTAPLQHAGHARDLQWRAGPSLPQITLGKRDLAC